MPPASHASTGSSRPPEPPSNPAPPEQYDPFNEAESYDYNPFGQNSPLRDSAHTLPPVPTAAVPQPNGSSAQQPQTDAAPAAEPATRKKRRTFDQPNLPLPPPPNATAANPSAANSIALDVNAVVPTPTAQPSRKRRSRWEDAPSVAQTKDDPTAIPDPPQIVSVSAATLPVSQAEASTLHANSLPVASQQIELQPSGIVLDTLVQPPLPPSQPPKATSAKQNGEAQAAAALIAVEQMLQAKRHAEGRVQPAAGIHRPAHPPPPPAPVQQQPPPPQSQPPLPPLPPPLAPQPALPQAHPSYPFGAPAVPFQTGQLLAGGPSRSPLGAAHMHGHQAWPHMSMPHMGHMQPHQHVHAGLQQHHVPAPMHHSPSMLQQQRWPQQQGVSQGTVPPHPPPPPQAPPPPQWGSPMQGNVHLHSQQTGNGPARATTAAAASGPPVRATAPQAPKWAPDAHFQDFPRTDDYATPMPTDVDSAFKTRRTSGPSAATAPVGSNPASDAPPAPPSPPPGPPSPPPAPPAAHSLPANSAPAQPNGPAASSAPSDEPAPPSNDNVVPQSEQSNGAAPSEGPADETIGTGSMVGGAAESRSTSPLLSSIAPGKTLYCE